MSAAVHPGTAHQPGPTDARRTGSSGHTSSSAPEPLPCDVPGKKRFRIWNFTFEVDSKYEVRPPASSPSNKLQLARHARLLWNLERHLALPTVLLAMTSHFRGLPVLCRDCCVEGHCWVLPGCRFCGNCAQSLPCEPLCTRHVLRFKASHACWLVPLTSNMWQSHRCCT
jgi:hypothetical protein